jgi:hypothetical protein
MYSILTAWVSARRFGFEAQQVIATRLVRSARCDAAASMEARRMINEKLEAFIEGSAAAGRAIAAGKAPDITVSAFVMPYRRRVRANHRRLHRDPSTSVRC